MDNQHGAGIAPPRRGGEPVRPRCGVPAAKLAWRAFGGTVERCSAGECGLSSWPRLPRCAEG